MGHPLELAYELEYDLQSIVKSGEIDFFSSMLNFFHLLFQVTAVLLFFKKYMSLSLIAILTLLRMEISRSGHGWWGRGGGFLLKICHTYVTMMKLCAIITYLCKIQKLYKSGDTTLEFC